MMKYCIRSILLAGYNYSSNNLIYFNKEKIDSSIYRPSNMVNTTKVDVNGFRLALIV